MNKEDFVSLECAKLLKEKGYNEPCLGYYFKSDFMFKVEPYRGADINALYEVPISPDDICAPTLYQAQKWLRDKHNIHIVCDVVYRGWRHLRHCVKYKGDNFLYDCPQYYPTYESALDAGIVEALKLI